MVTMEAIQCEYNHFLVVLEGIDMNFQNPEFAISGIPVVSWLVPANEMAHLRSRDSHTVEVVP
ncbi:hypothetical protein FCULG_00005576 [Fusarium culmorum]|uniref:Uncharacterized protein n=1 Tax=Fusarium culmorum TaxID=5516 RepID=A0A2T4GSW4_FUSCU|nr:hypothetical protein FCULG_00005576 [Fusarium culmorum]